MEWGATIMGYHIEMYDFLSASTADYTSTDLNVSPQKILEESGSKNQIIHMGDDGSEERISLDNDPIFYVNLQWDVLGSTDAGKIVNFYYSTGVANGIHRSFRWVHPTDGHTYTVRFASDLRRFERPGNVYGIHQVKLRILGKAT